MSTTSPQHDPERVAEQAKLRYVAEGAPGISRRRRGKGFSYYDPQGRPLRDPQQCDRIRRLAIPPAWREVWISPRADGHILATGRDDKGRKQYIYHPRWTELRTLTNFHQLLAFGRALPALRARIEADLRRPGLPRERVLALVVELLQSTLIRVGNPEYARRNRSFGLTTLRQRHLELEGGHIHLQFRGKHGKLHSVDLQDRRVARILRRCQELPGQELFQYLDPQGVRHPVESADVNAYLSATTGEEFTAKVFRTWGGSAAMVRALLDAPPPQSRSQAERQLRLALDETSRRLMNTVAVCRRHYVHPLIAQRYLAGDFAQRCRSGSPPDPALNEEEGALLRLLASEA